MSIFGASWEKIEIKRIPSISGGPDVPGGSGRPRKLIPAVFDPDSDDADLDGWRQEGTTARWYGLSKSNPIYRLIATNIKKIDNSDDDASWLPPGHTTLEEWLGTISRLEDKRLKAPPVELSTFDADLSFVGGYIDQRISRARERGMDAPNIASESRRAAAWVKGREILRKRAGKSEEVLGEDESILERAERLIDELKKKRVERDKKIRQIVELDEDTKRRAKKFSIDDFVAAEMPPWDEWRQDYEIDNPKPLRGEYDTEEDFEDALYDWEGRRDLDYEQAVFDSEDTSELREEVDQIFSFTFTTESGNSYYVSVNGVDEVNPDSFTFDFTIFTEGDRTDGIRTGTRVGSAVRTIYFNKNSVYNENFRLEDEFRGDQISTVIAARNEQIYALMGLTEVEVSAASGLSMNGASHWPKVGFNWASERERVYFIDQVEAALNYFSSEIQDNPNELPMVSSTRNNQRVEIPLFASREEAEILMALIKRAKSEDFYDPDALTAGDLVNWSGAEFWFKNMSMIVSLSKSIGLEPPSNGVKWLIIESEVKAVNKPNVPNVPNIGGPSKPRALKPAAFDRNAIDADNDGWRQEGTTARWFGAALNNPVVQELRSSFEKLGPDDVAGSSSVMQTWDNFGIYSGAPDPNVSSLDADLSWLGGKILQEQQTALPTWGSGSSPFMDDESLARHGQWLQGREEVRRRQGIREEVMPTPNIEQISDEDAIKVLDEIVTARKERRALRDAKTRVNAEDAVTDEVRSLARQFDHADYPEDPDVEILDYDDWKAANGGLPDPPSFPFGGTPEEVDEYNRLIEEYHQRSAEIWDEYYAYKSEQSALKNKKLKEAITSLLEFEFVAGNGKKYSTKVDQVDQEVNTIDRETGDLGVLITVRGQFYNEDGIAVGFFERTFIPDRKMVIHDHMKIDEFERGSQVTGVFNSRNEIVYREMGYTEIGAGATSGADYNGATHWPKVGFDWMTDESRNDYLDTVEGAVIEFAVAIKENPDELPMLTKLIPSEGSPLPGGGTEVKIPIFASREEAELVAMLVTAARNQKFDDPDRLTAADLVNWPGAELWFQQRSHSSDMKRTIGEIEETAEKGNAPDTPDASEQSEGLIDQIRDKNKKILDKIKEVGGSWAKVTKDFKERDAEQKGGQILPALTPDEVREFRRAKVGPQLERLQEFMRTGKLPKNSDNEEIQKAEKEIFERSVEGMTPELREFLITASVEEILDAAENAAVEYHKGFDGPVRVRVPNDRLADFLRDGRYKTTHETSSRNSGADARTALERLWGIPADAEPEVRPASGYLIHKDVLAAADQEHFDRTGKMPTDHSLLPMKEAGDVGAYGHIELVLHPEVSKRTAYARGDTLNNASTVVSIDSDDRVAIANAVLDARGARSDRGMSFVLSFVDAALKGSYKDASSPSSWRGQDSSHDYVEAAIAGSFDLDEVTKVIIHPKAVERYSFATIDKDFPRTTTPEYLNGLRDQFYSREGLLAAGLSPEEVDYIFEENLLGGQDSPLETVTVSNSWPGYQGIQRLIRYDKRVELEDQLKAAGVQEIIHLDPSGLDGMDPASWGEQFAGMDSREIREYLARQEILEEMRLRIRNKRNPEPRQYDSPF